MNSQHSCDKQSDEIKKPSQTLDELELRNEDESVDELEFRNGKSNVVELEMKRKNGDEDEIVDLTVSRQKSIGVIGGLAIVTGSIIGSGIFITVGDTMRVSPPSFGLLMVYWIIGGVISLLGGMCYVELGIMLPKSGGERTYLAEAFGYRFGVIFTYSYVFLVKSISIAAIGLTTGKYFVEMFLSNMVGTENIERMVAIMSILIVFIINSLSTVAAARTQIYFTVAKLLALVVIIITGFVQMAREDVKDFKQPFVFDEINYIELGVCFINIFFCFEGWNTLGAVVGEMRNPARDLPISICLGVLVVLFMYCSTIAAYIAVLGYNTVTYIDTVAILFAEKMFKRASFIIPIFICFSTFGATNGSMLSVARVALMSGYEGDIPKVFSLVHRVKRTPVVSLFALTLASCMFVFTQFQILLKYCAFVSWMFYFITMVSLIYMRVKRPDLVHKFKVPLFVPVIVQIVAVFMVVMSFYETPIGCSVILGLILLVFSIHWLPERILKPKCAVKGHNWLCFQLQNSFNLVFADKHDIS